MKHVIYRPSGDLRITAGAAGFSWEETIKWLIEVGRIKVDSDTGGIICPDAVPFDELRAYFLHQSKTSLALADALERATEAAEHMKETVSA